MLTRHLFDGEDLALRVAEVGPGLFVAVDLGDGLDALRLQRSIGALDVVDGETDLEAGPIVLRFI